MTRPTRLIDVAFVLAVLAVTVALVVPSRGGILVHYMDNPVHIAELRALSTETHHGWTDIAYCGYFLGGTHSPIWYGIAGVLVRLGVPAALVYGFFLLIGLVGPSIAVYWVGRRRGVPTGSVIISLTLMLLPAVLVGVGSVLGGMWPFNLSIAVLVLLIDRLSRDKQDASRFTWIAALTGFSLLTHLFVVVPLAVVMCGRFLLPVVRRAVRIQDLGNDLLAFFVGWIAACVYWLPFADGARATSFDAQHLSPTDALLRIVTPVRVLDQLTGQGSVWDFWWQGFPLWILIGFVALGLFKTKSRRDDLPLYGVILTVTIIVMIAFIAGNLDVAFFGPWSWRMLSFTFVGMALSALPGVAGIERMKGRWLVTAIAIVLAVIQATAIGVSLRAAGPPSGSATMMPVTQLWEWLHENRTDDWGRVYLQDTFRVDREGWGRLPQSHVLALTSAQTGVRQLGPSYGFPIQKTGVWTPSEFGTLFRRAIRSPEDIDYVKRMLWATNSTHLVTSDPPTSGIIQRFGGFEILFEADPFYVFAVDQPSQWQVTTSRGGVAKVTSFETGRIELVVRDAAQPTDVVVKAAYHPYWRIQSDIGGTLRENESGLLTVESIGAEGGTVQLEFAPPRWPLLISLISWGIIAGVGVRGARRSRRGRHRLQ